MSDNDDRRWVMTGLIATAIVLFFVVAGFFDGPRDDKNTQLISPPPVTVREVPAGTFYEPDGRLRVDCDHFEVLCDDEEA